MIIEIYKYIGFILGAILVIAAILIPLFKKDGWKHLNMLYSDSLLGEMLNLDKEIIENDTWDEGVAQGIFLFLGFVTHCTLFIILGLLLMIIYPIILVGFIVSFLIYIKKKK